MKFTDFLRDIGRPVAFFPALTEITGSTTATLFLSQMVYWTGRQRDREGWIFKSQAEIKSEIGLTRSEQETARAKLKMRGFLEERYAQLPRKLLYRINVEAINNAWDQHAIMQESRIIEEPNPTDLQAEILHAITETTPEITNIDKETGEIVVTKTFSSEFAERWQQETGQPVTPMIVEELRDIEQRYPGLSPIWAHDAIREATLSNVRSPRYVFKVVERWATKGRYSSRDHNDRNESWEPSPVLCGCSHLRTHHTFVSHMEGFGACKLCDCKMFGQGAADVQPGFP